jgi:signal transduction histidine kinase
VTASDSPDEVLKRKAMLLLRREQELLVMRRERERADAWLRLFHSLSVGARRDRDDVAADWAMWIIRDLHFQTAAVFAVDGRALVLVGGLSNEDLPARLELPERVLGELRARGGGVRNEGGDPNASWLASAVALDRMLWQIAARDGSEWLMVAGFAPDVSRFYERLTDSDRLYFELVGQHLAALMRNTELIAELERHLFELTAAQEQLVRGEQLQAVGRLAAAVSHEVNNPLTVVLANLDELRFALQGEGGSMEAIANDAFDAARRIAEMLARLRGFDVKRPEVIEAIDLSALLHECAREAGGAATVTAGRCAVVHLARHDLRTAIIDLLHALAAPERARRGPSQLVARLVHDAGRIAIELADPSLAVTEDDARRLFEPQLGVDADRKRVRFDLSLAIAHQLLHRNGARVTATAADGLVIRIVMPAE